MMISSTQTAQPVNFALAGWQRVVETQLAETGTVRESDQVLLGFLQGLDAKLREQGIDPQKVNMLNITYALGLDDNLNKAIEKFESSPLYLAMEERGRQNAENSKARGAKPTDDPAPKLDLDSLAIIPGILNRTPVSSQSEMMTRLQEYYNPFNTLASNPEKVNAAYDKYVSELNAWKARRNSNPVDRRDFDAEIQRNTKHWAEQRDVYAAALEVAKSFDFFTKNEFVA
ncbi:MAG: hypothetical protein AB7E49_11165 [Campylobacterales bacterium]